MYQKLLHSFPPSSRQHRKIQNSVPMTTKVKTRGLEGLWILFVMNLIRYLHDAIWFVTTYARIKVDDTIFSDFYFSTYNSFTKADTFSMAMMLRKIFYTHLHMCCIQK